MSNVISIPSGVNIAGCFGSIADCGAGDMCRGGVLQEEASTTEEVHRCLYTEHAQFTSGEFRDLWF